MFGEQMLRLLKHRNYKPMRLKSRLKGVNGFTGRGEIRYCAKNDGVKKLNITLSGLAGVEAEIYFNAERFTKLRVSEGMCNFTITTSQDEEILLLKMNEKVEIKQNGQTVLFGEMSVADKMLMRLPSFSFNHLRP